MIDFEAGKRAPHAASLGAIRTPLEDVGVEFVPAGAVLEGQAAMDGGRVLAATIRVLRKGRRPLRLVGAEKFLYMPWCPLIFNRMVKRHSVDAVFAALADPTRRAILSRLAAGEATVGELAAPLPMSGPAVTKHLKVLEGAGLITRQRLGRIHRLGFNGAAMAEAAAWVTHYHRFWNNQFDALAGYLAEPDGAAPEGHMETRSLSE